MTLGDPAPPPADVQAAGVKSIAAREVSGIAATGDHTYIDNRQINLAPGALLAPAEVACPAGGVWNLPRRVDQIPFVGREQVMAVLAGVLESGSGVIAQAIAGLGGIGKTELALRHAWAHRDRHPAVWWVTADTPANIEAGMAGLAYRLHPPIQPATTSAEAARWATGWLQAHPGALLILDNVDVPTDIQALLGHLDGTHVLVTTRRDVDWRRTGLTALRLGVLDPSAAADLLVELSGDPDHHAAAALAKQLGCLPLALDQAGAYITEHRIGLADYRSLLEADPGRVLTTPPEGSPTDRAAAQVWNLTRRAIERRNRLATRLLDILAWLGPDALPRDVLHPAADNPADTADSLAVLASYSMISLTADTVSLHRLVQTITRLNPPTRGDADPGLPTPAEEAARLLKQAIPAEPLTNVAGWPRWRALLPHIDAMADLTPDHDAGDNLAYLLDRAGTYQQGEGQHNAAVPKFERAAALNLSRHGPDHRHTLEARNNLAYAYTDAGRTSEAITLYEQILPACVRTLGPDHPHTLDTRNGLASAYRAAGRPKDAIILYKQVLPDRERLLGPDHPHTLGTRHGLAYAHQAAGRTTEAITLYEQLLPDYERVLGPDHRHTLTTRHSLAYAYQAAGRTNEAITLYEQLLPNRERVLGPDHRHTLTTRHSLAQAYQATGRTTEAITLYEQILPHYERLHGPHHPNTMTTRQNLAAAYREAGRTTPARPKASASPDPSETDSTGGLRGGPDPTDLSHAG
jgi:tetratricopeptide (TPR) repeat protein